jgi:hypothetical protein
MFVALSSSESSSRIEKEMLAAHDFLMPWFIVNGDKYYYLHKKKNFHDFKVAIVDKHTIRFKFFLDSRLDGIEGFEHATAEFKNFLLYDVSCDTDFEVLSIFDDDHFKGVEVVEILTKKTNNTAELEFH